MAQGRVYDYRIVSGPTDEATRSQIENLLLAGVFEPARFFGQPVRGLAVTLLLRRLRARLRSVPPACLPFDPARASN